MAVQSQVGSVKPEGTHYQFGKRFGNLLWFAAHPSGGYTCEGHQVSYDLAEFTIFFRFVHNAQALPDGAVFWRVYAPRSLSSCKNKSGATKNGFSAISPPMMTIG